MNDDADEPQVDPVTKVARDLTAIEELAATIEPQALAKSNDRLMPGGLAMVSLAPDASLDDWAEQIAHAELHHLADPKRYAYPDHVADEDDQESEDPLRTLLFWSDDWRIQHGYPLEGRRPTLESEAAFIRWALNWAWDYEPHFEDMARDVNAARRRLEQMLHAGRRAVRTRVPCDRVKCERKPRLIRVFDLDPAKDHYRCTGCKTRFDADEFRDAYARHLRSEGAQRYVLKADAIATLILQGTAARTVHRWLEPPIQHVADKCRVCKRKWPPQEYPACPGKVRGEECGGELRPLMKRAKHDVIYGYCDVATHKTFVWWPDLWRLHMAKLSQRRAGVRDETRKSA